MIVGQRKLTWEDIDMSNLDIWNRSRTSPVSFFDEVFNLMSDFDRLGATSRSPTRSGDVMLAPACDITETKEGYVLAFDVPGMKKEDIGIELSGRSLIISGEKKREDEYREGQVYRSERSYGKFTRTFELPEGVNADLIEASCEHGVLKIAVPKAEEKKARRIEVGESSKGFLSKLVGKTDLKIAKS